MAEVKIVQSLLDELEKKFKGRAQEAIDLMESVADSPHKGQVVGYVTGMLIKELKYEGFRFYFIVDGGKLKFFSKEQLSDLLIKFVRMSNKKEQQKTIDEIKIILKNLGVDSF